jgi:hypothetical protein
MPLDGQPGQRATLPAMRFAAFFFAYFWFSHRTGAREANA